MERRTPRTRWPAAALVCALAAVARAGTVESIQFTDVTEATGIDFTQHGGDAVPPLMGGQSARYGGGGAAGDYDGDGDHDLYLCDGFGSPNRLFRNEGDGTFTDVTETAGVGDLGWSRMAMFLDLDGDGFDDLLVVNDCSRQSSRFPCSRVYRNDGDGTFTDVTDGSGLMPVDPVMGGVTAGDYDGDGDLDLFFAGWFGYSRHLYRNDGAFIFTDVTDAAHAHVAGNRFQWTPLFADLDDDGALDLFCAVDFDEDYVLRNLGDGTFVDATKEAGTTHVANDMGVAWGDLTGNGAIDLYTTNITGGEECAVPHGCNMLYLNDGAGHFADGTAAHGVGDTGWAWGTWLFDAELDGDLDLIAVNGWLQPQWQEAAVLFRNDGGGSFTDVASAAGVAHVGDTRGLIPIDLEGDGDVDVVLTDTLGAATVYENRSPRDGRHWLVVTAQGTASNRNGIGARITVTAGGQRQVGWILAGGSFYAGPPLEAHFGLGAHASATVEVQFPSGRAVTLEDVAADRRLTVVEPAAPCPTDVDGDGATGFGDLLDVLASWGACASCPADLDGDGVVGAADVALLFTAWGPCSP